MLKNTEKLSILHQLLATGNLSELITLHQKQGS